MTGTHRVVEITFAEAEVLADLYGIMMDLQAVQRLCQEVPKLPNLGAAHAEVVDGIVIAALTKYMRCFAGGSRLGLKSTDVQALPPDLQDAHDFFNHLRDKHVAHPVNPLEDTFVTTTVSEIDGELLPVTSLNPGRESIVLSIGDAEAICALASATEAHLAPRVARAEADLIDFLKSLPLEKVHELDLHEPRRRHTSAYVRQSRKQAEYANNLMKPIGEDASG